MPDNKLNEIFSRSALSDYTFGEKLKVRAAGFVFWLLISLIGVTIRWQIEGEENFRHLEAPVMCFWHDHMFLATYFFRKKNMVALASQSKDGELMAQCIQRFGYGVVRGSSTRGGVKALVEMAKLAEAGFPIAITTDGPKGPRHVAKPGGIVVGQRSRRSVIACAVIPSRAIVMNTWDRLIIPLPFAKAKVVFGKPIEFADNKGGDDFEANLTLLQSSLDEATESAKQLRQTK